MDEGDPFVAEVMRNMRKEACRLVGSSRWGPRSGSVMRVSQRFYDGVKEEAYRHSLIMGFNTAQPESDVERYTFKGILLVPDARLSDYEFEIRSPKE